MSKLSSFHALSTMLVVSLFIFAGLSSCSKDEDDPVDCTGLTPTYNNDVKAILDASCAKSGCHDAVTAQNGVNLSTYATAAPISMEERFLGVIQHKSGFPAMPADGPQLPSETIQILACWVENGSPQ